MIRVLAVPVGNTNSAVADNDYWRKLLQNRVDVLQQLSLLGMSSPSHEVRTIMGCEDLSGLRSRRDDT